MTSVDTPSYLVVGPESRPIPIHKDEMTVGRLAENDVFLDHSEVSRRHATLTRRGGQILLTDMGSSNGTFVNGARVHGTMELHDGDRIRFAAVETVFHTSLPSSTLSPRSPGPVASPTSRSGETAYRSAHPTSAGPIPDRRSPIPAQPGQQVPQRPSGGPSVPPSAALERLGDAPILLSEGEITIGRIPGNDVVLDDSRVSSHHARILHEEGEYFVVDLQSSNGTYVNGRRITEPWMLEQGDEVVMGETQFIFRRLRKLPKKRKGAPRAPGARPTGPGPKT